MEKINNIQVNPGLWEFLKNKDSQGLQDKSDQWNQEEEGSQLLLQ